MGRRKLPPQLDRAANTISEVVKSIHRVNRHTKEVMSSGFAGGTPRTAPYVERIREKDTRAFLHPEEAKMGNKPTLAVDDRIRAAVALINFGQFNNREAAEILDVSPTDLSALKNRTYMGKWKDEESRQLDTALVSFRKGVVMIKDRILAAMDRSLAILESVVEDESRPQKEREKAATTILGLTKSVISDKDLTKPMVPLPSGYGEGTLGVDPKLFDESLEEEKPS